MLKKFVVASLFFISTIASAYPTGPVTIIVPFPAGQSGDIVARMLGIELAKKTAQSFIIENKPGAGGRTGTALAARAKPDGYTLLLTSTGPFAISPALYPATTFYDPIKDFSAIAQVGATPQIIAVSNQSGIQNMAGLVSAAKSKDLSYASAGNGSTQHLTMELLKLQLGFPLVHVPFKGSAESKTQIMSGLIAATSDSLPAILPQIKSGQIKALAIVDAVRSPYLPEVPTLAESGFPNFSTVAFFGVMAPRGTPQSIVDQLNQDILEIVATPAFREKFKDLALSLPQNLTATQFQDYLTKEVAKWKEIIVSSNVKVE